MCSTHFAALATPHVLLTSRPCCCSCRLSVGLSCTQRRLMHELRGVLLAGAGCQVLDKLSFSCQLGLGTKDGERRSPGRGGFLTHAHTLVCVHTHPNAAAHMRACAKTTEYTGPDVLTSQHGAAAVSAAIGGGT